VARARVRARADRKTAGRRALAATAGRRALAAVLSLAASCGGDGVPVGGTPPVVVVAIDTLRADRLGAYGYELATTPHLDAFARDAYRFAANQTQVNSTFPSMTSILTGLYPRTHQSYVAVPVDGLVGDRETPPTLAERLGERGYFCASVWSHPLWTGAFWSARARSAVRRGWHAELPIPASIPLGERVAHDHAEHANERAFALLERHRAERPDAPLFLWVHYFDPHTPYAPPQPFRDRFLAANLARYGVPGAQAELARRAPEERKAWIDERRDPARRAALKLANGSALYDGELAYCDAAVGRLFDRLRELRLYDDALIVVLADHGENLENPPHAGGWIAFSHERLFEAVSHTPLLVKLPGQRKGAVVGAVTQNVDLLPTLLELLDLPHDPRLEGRSLVGLLREPEGSLHAAVYTESSGDAELAIKTETLKYIDPGDGADPLCFRWRDDPLEREDLTDRLEPPLVEGFAAMADGYRVRDVLRVRLLPDAEPYELTLELALGHTRFERAECSTGEGLALADDGARVRWSGRVADRPVELTLEPRERSTQQRWRIERPGHPDLASRVRLGRLPLAQTTALSVLAPGREAAPPDPRLAYVRAPGSLALELAPAAAGDVHVELRFARSGYDRLFEHPAPGAVQGLAVELLEERAEGGSRLRLKGRAGTDAVVGARIAYRPPEAEVLVLARVDGRWVPRDEVAIDGRAPVADAVELVVPFPRPDGRITGALLAGPEDAAEAPPGAVQLWLESAAGGVAIDAERLEDELADELRSLGYVK